MPFAINLENRIFNLVFGIYNISYFFVFDGESSQNNGLLQCNDCNVMLSSVIGCQNGDRLSKSFNQPIDQLID